MARQGSPQPTGPRRIARLSLVAIASLLSLSVACASRSLCWLAGGDRPRGSLGSPVARGGRVKVRGTAIDTFDPWTVLGISPTSSQDEARKAYKKLIAKYHPDVDPSREAEAKFQQVVRAHAVITGEDKVLDSAQLLKNAVSNLRNDMEFKRQQIERLKAQAAAEEQEIMKMQERLEAAEAQSKEVTSELGAFGGAALGFLVGGPAGAVAGAVLGLALKDRDDAVGQLLRGSGNLVKGVAGIVGKTVASKAESKE